MERGSPWIKFYHYRTNMDSWETNLDQGDSESFPDAIDEEQKKALVSADSILPDDILERILSSLPVASIFRAGSVCKRWNEMVSSRRFVWNSNTQAHNKPWYFMFTSSEYGLGYAYDPTLRKWHGIDLPEFVTPNWYTASSQGLVCFMDSDTRSKIYVCNPITKSCKKIMEPPGSKICDYSSLAISIDRVSQVYSIYIVKSKQVPENFDQCELSIDVYDSETMKWTTSVNEVLNGWRSGDESVICDDNLYFMVYSTQVGVQNNARYGVIRYNLSSQSHDLLTRSFLQVPCALTCERLMNLNEKLVMVGGIAKQDRPDIIKGIGIWGLKGNEWEEVARMHHKFLQGFGELDDVFASGGTDELIYIHSYGSPALVVFDMNNKQFKWSQKCPVAKKFALQLFTGFCFQPRLEITP